MSAVWNCGIGALSRRRPQLLDDHVHHCVMGAEGDEQAEKTDELMAAVVGLMRSG
jgi:CsoR family transcriptional regulator, copper-sensing transcriptional repressor